MFFCKQHCLAVQKLLPMLPGFYMDTWICNQIVFSNLIQRLEIFVSFVFSTTLGQALCLNISLYGRGLKVVSMLHWFFLEMLNDFDSGNICFFNATVQLARLITRDAECILFRWVVVVILLD